MTIYNDVLHILGAQNNVIQRINLLNGKELDSIYLNTEGFTTNFNKIEGSDLAVYVDVKKNLYSIVDLAKGRLIKTYATSVPLKEVIITNRIELFK